MEVALYHIVELGLVEGNSRRSLDYVTNNDFLRTLTEDKRCDMERLNKDIILFKV
jgi:hypothetical protein